MNKEVLSCEPRNSLSNISLDKDIYKSIDLYHCEEYHRDIWKGSNYLSNLSDEKAIQTIKYNLKYYGELSKIRKHKGQVYLIYHKLLIYSSKSIRKPNEYDGFFTLVDKNRTNNFLCSYTTFSKLVKRCIKDKLSIENVFVSQGYGIKNIVDKVDLK